MTYQHQGYHNAADEEVAELTKQGWTIITDEEWKKVLDKKRGKVEVVAKAKAAAVPSAVIILPAPAPSVKHGDRSDGN